MRVKTNMLEKPVREYHDEQLLDILKLTPQEVRHHAEMNREEALALVGMYYSIQKVRVGSRNKEAAHERRSDMLSDPFVITMLKEHLEKIEGEARRVLTAYARTQKLGRWAMSNHGVGPILTAAMLAHIDVTKSPTAGGVWKFAGMIDPKLLKWEKGQKRPYNARLKTVCFLLGESFKRTANSPESFYGKIYRERKALEVARNEAGEFKQKALDRLEEAKRGRYAISPLQRETWASGKLQAVGLDRRAMRYAVRFFLSHYHHVGCCITYGRAPDPWVIRYGGHTHFVPPPNFPMKEDF